MRVMVETPFHSFTGRTVEGVYDDLDGTFIMICDDDGERLKVNGWQCDITIIPACESIWPEDGPITPPVSALGPTNVS